MVTRHAHSKEAAVLRNLAGVDRLKIHRYDGLFLRPRTIRHIQIAPGIINCHDLFPEDAFRWKSNLAISCNGVSTVEIYIYIYVGPHPRRGASLAEDTIEVSIHKG